MTNKFKQGLLSLIFFGWAASANATPIISNLSENAWGQTRFTNILETTTKDAGWTMGANSYNFTNAILKMNLYSGNREDPVVQLFSGATPTNLLTTLIFDAPGSVGLGDYSLTSATEIILAAGETYWLRVAVVVDQSVIEEHPNFEWLASDVAPSGIATNAGYLWRGSPSIFLNKYEINGTAVPEPGVLGLLSLGLLGLGITRRRKSR